VWSLGVEARFFLGIAVTVAALVTGYAFLRKRHHAASVAAFAIAVLALALPVVIFILAAGSS
jgi:hypothetical protein